MRRNNTKNQQLVGYKVMGHDNGKAGCVHVSHGDESVIGKSEGEDEGREADGASKVDRVADGEEVVDDVKAGRSRKPGSTAPRHGSTRSCR